MVGDYDFLFRIFLLVWQLILFLLAFTFFGWLLLRVIRFFFGRVGMYILVFITLWSFVSVGLFVFYDKGWI